MKKLKLRLIQSHTAEGGWANTQTRYDYGIILLPIVRIHYWEGTHIVAQYFWQPLKVFNLPKQMIHVW